MPNHWNLLVVDDEPDVHAITKLALRRKTWRERGFRILSAESGTEARSLLAEPAGADIQVALVDVVMETEEAGLELCKWIRCNYPRSLRLVLRTGQPGMAPKDEVFDEFDIDYYLEKTEADASAVFGAVRAGLRISLDISVLVRLEQHIRTATAQLRDGESLDALFETFRRNTRDMIASVHNADAVLWHDSVDQQGTTAEQQRGVDRAARIAERLIQSGHLDRILSTADVPELGTGECALVTRVASGQPAAQKGYFGVLIGFDGDISSNRIRDLFHDLEPFLDSWRLGYSTVALQERDARNRAAKTVARSHRQW